MLNILVVEDEAPIREWVVYTINQLSNDFMVVGSATNGKEAFELFQVLRPNVIVTDIKMPVMDGLELIQKVKREDPSVYIILLTNHAEFSYAKQAITLGVEEYLVKSEIRTKEIKEVLEKIQEKLYREEISELTYDSNEARVEELEKLDQKETYSKAITRALAYIEEKYSEGISLQDIAKHVFLSPEYFSRLFKEEVGENFVSYLTAFRMNKAKEMIRRGDMKISQIGYTVGYSNPGYFSKTYKKYMGVSPEEDRYDS